MINAKTLETLEVPDNPIPYFLGTRMRKVKDIRDKVLWHPGRYRQVRPEGIDAKDPAALKVKQVVLNDRRYIVCLNPGQAGKEARDRDKLVMALDAQLKKGAKSLLGNKGFRKYLTIEKDSARIDTAKIKSEARFDGKWMLTTNTVPFAFPSGAQVQGTLAGGESLPGRQIVAYDPSDLPPMR